MTRRERIVLLIGSRFDFDVGLPTSTGRLVAGLAARGGRRGEVPTEWRECVRCDGVGEVRDRFGRPVACPECKGARGSWVDGYTGAAVATEDDAPGRSFGEQFRVLLERDTRYVLCPDCQDLSGRATGVVHGRVCRRCRGTGEAAVAGSWLSLPEREGSGGSGDERVDALVRRQEQGSYDELFAALGEVRSRAALGPRALRLLDEVFLPPPDRFEEELDGWERELVNASLGLIDSRMPDPVRVPAAVVANQRARRLRPVKGRVVGAKALEERNRQIRARHRQGRSVQWLAADFGLSVRTVYEILEPVTHGS